MNNNERRDFGPKMEKQTWYCALFDILGLLSLMCAMVALSGAIWFIDILSQALLFKLFYGCLATSITSFMLCRVVQILGVIVSTPDPRQARAQAEPDTAIAIDPLVVHEQDVTDGSFSRAA